MCRQRAPYWAMLHFLELCCTFWAMLQLAEPQGNLPSYAAPYWATLQPLSRAAPYWATVHPAELRNALPLWASSTQLSFSTPSWAKHHSVCYAAPNLSSYQCCGFGSGRIRNLWPGWKKKGGSGYTGNSGSEMNNKLINFTISQQNAV
jgi:hypothetical protein